MDELNTSDRAAQATALLGLRLADSDTMAVGPTPTVEELSSLYDGSLDAIRRAQVLSHIAATPDAYQAFLEIASAQATLDENLVEQLVSAPAAPSLLARLGSWLNTMVRTPAVPGGMVAAALVVVLLLPGQETSDTGSWQDIDQIYTKFGNDWQTSPSTLADRSVRGTSSKAEAPAELQAIYLGLHAGLAMLGDEFPQKWLPTVSVDEKVDALPKELRDALEATGKLATVTRFQCQLEGSEAFFLAAQKSLDMLRPNLDIEPTKATKRLARVIDQPGSPRERMCDFSNAAVALLSAK